MKLSFIILLLAFALAPVTGAEAQLAPTNIMMLQASQSVMAQDYRKAEELYNQVIATDSSLIDAYIQRAVVRREVGNLSGMAGDANIAIQLASSQLAAKPNNAKLHWQRGMGYRLLKQFTKARSDIQDAVRLDPGNSSWQDDLQAMALEEKMG